VVWLRRGRGACKVTSFAYYNDVMFSGWQCPGSRRRWRKQFVSTSKCSGELGRHSRTHTHTHTNTHTRKCVGSTQKSAKWRRDRAQLSRKPDEKITSYHLAPRRNARSCIHSIASVFALSCLPATWPACISFPELRVVRRSVGTIQCPDGGLRRTVMATHAVSSQVATRIMRTHRVSCHRVTRDGSTGREATLATPGGRPPVGIDAIYASRYHRRRSTTTRRQGSPRATRRPTASTDRLRWRLNAENTTTTSESRGLSWSTHWSRLDSRRMRNGVQRRLFVCELRFHVSRHDDRHDARRMLFYRSACYPGRAGEKTYSSTVPLISTPHTISVHRFVPR